MKRANLIIYFSILDYFTKWSSGREQPNYQRRIHNQPNGGVWLKSKQTGSVCREVQTIQGCEVYHKSWKISSSCIMKKFCTRYNFKKPGNAESIKYDVKINWVK